MVSMANFTNYSHFWKMFSNLDVISSDNCTCLMTRLGLFGLQCFP